MPDLARPGHREAWYRLEVAKRRLFYTLLALRLPIVDRDDDPDDGLAFEFMADPDDPAQPPVLTGHAHGVITLNVAEADDAERERRRASLHEPYRTLLGHFRHEIGHYYWDRLIAGSAVASRPSAPSSATSARDYAAALQRHYAAGPPADWQDPVRQRLRQRAPVGGLGRDVGALPPHRRHARNRARPAASRSGPAAATSRP